jgi:hypothetical protein
MYGFCRLGFIPAPSTGATCVSKGEATKTRSSAKKLAIAPRIGTVQGSTVRTRRLFRATAADPIPVRTRSQRRSEPSCPLQKDESV